MIPFTVLFFLSITICSPPNLCNILKLEENKYAVEIYHYKPHNEYIKEESIELESGNKVLFKLIHKNQEGNKNNQSQILGF